MVTVDYLFWLSPLMFLEPPLTNNHPTQPNTIPFKLHSEAIGKAPWVVARGPFRICKDGVGDGGRTRDPLLGKQMLYH